MSFLLALALVKRVSELHGLSFHVRHLRSWRSCTISFFPDFVAKIQNLYVPDSRFDEFLVPSLDDFGVDDGDELLLCRIRALHKYLTWTGQYRPGIEGLFVSTGWLKKQVSHNTVSFSLRPVITLAHASASEEDCRSLRVRAHKVRKVAISLLYCLRGTARFIRY